MGDSKTPVLSKDSKLEISSCDFTTPSIDILKPVKPSQNIAISKNELEEPPSNTADISKSDVKKDLERINKSPRSEEIKQEAKVDETNLKRTRIIKNKSHIFSLSENKNLTSTIFSIGGAPSRTIHKLESIEKNKKSTTTIGTQDSIVSRQNQVRNPLTGIGVSSNDEFKTKPSKRKGLPLIASHL